MPLSLSTSSTPTSNTTDHEPYQPALLHAPKEHGHCVWSTPLLAPGRVVAPEEPTRDFTRAEIAKVSDVALYAHCRHAFTFGAVHRIMDLSIPRLFSPPTAAEMGSAFHRYVKSVEAHWDSTYRLDRAAAALAREWYPTNDDDLRRHAKTILHAADRLESSRWGRQMATHRASLRREYSFSWGLSLRTILEGTVDAVYERHGGLTIVDYKTGFLDEAVDPSLAMCSLVQRYEVQAAAYALALEGVSNLPVDRVVFYHTETGSSHVLRVTAAWLQSWHGRLTQLTDEMPDAAHRAERQERFVEVYDAARCDRCRFRKLCRPVGDPTAPPSDRDITPSRTLACGMVRR